MSSPSFLLIGNGPYDNRGCEAIVRGTTHIIDTAFGERTTYILASFGTRSQILAQASCEILPRLRHHWLSPKPRLTIDYAKYQLNRFFGVSTTFCVNDLPQDARCCRAALQVGGDNYSLDYGYPRAFMGIDRELARRGLPLVLWGASVGPFDADPHFEQQMVDHLSQFRLITVRESTSYNYLCSLGLNNLIHVADPAFVMEPQSVPDLRLPAEFLAVNLSTLAGAKLFSGDYDTWTCTCAAAIRQLTLKCDLPLVLVPHVTKPNRSASDHALLQAVAQQVRRPSSITVLQEGYTAAQLKWIIGRAVAFAGARTHSTIASLAMGVPTLSIAYSVKAWGINQDVFGNATYCMDVRDFLEEDALAYRMLALLEHRESITRDLRSRVPVLKAKAMAAGLALRKCLGGSCARTASLCTSAGIST